MNSLLKHWKPMVLGFASVMFGSLPVLADDTEIYFGATNSGVKNNILFVIDTSGSMSSLDGDSTSRIDELKTAFTSLLNHLDNVNVGLMRFSNPGGPVLYPVSSINKTLPLDASSGVISKTLASSSDDGYQINSSGVVDITSSSLEMGTHSTTVTAPYTVPTTIVAGSSYDADECVWASGTSSSSSNTTNLTNGTLRTYLSSPPSGCSSSGGNANQRIAGVIFSGVTIPANAVIDTAYITFTANAASSGSGSIDLTFRGLYAASAATAFSTSSGPYSRWSGGTGATVNVSYSASSISSLASVQSPNLAPIVQQIVNGGDLASGGSIGILYRHNTGSSNTARAEFDAYDYSGSATPSPNYRPKLTITYHIDSTLSYDTTTAIRFTDVNLPRNAKVTSAYLTFTAGSSTAGTSSLTIKGQASGNATTIGTSSNNITSRTATTASVTWSALSTPALTDWTAGTNYQSPDLTAVVQEIANRSDWCGGNAMAFLLSGVGQRIAASYDAGSSTAPTLVINYDPNTVPTDGTTCKKTTLTRQITSSSDDAQEDDGTSAAMTTNKTLSLAATVTTTRSGGRRGTTTTTGVASKIGLRFNNVVIPQGSTIQSAYLQFQANGSDSSTVNLTIYGQAADNPTTFTATDESVNGRARTTQSVSWSGVSSWNSGTAYQSPDITTIVQALVNRTGWAPGNSMAFILTGDSALNIRRAYSFDGSSGNAPKLVINYIDNGTATSTYTVKDRLIEIVDSLSPGGYTPLQDTMYEGVQYFRGQPVLYGKVRGTSATGGPYAYTRVSHPDSLVAGSYTSITPAGCTDSSSSSCASETINGSPQYQSPISYACQKNHIVLLTDGLPNSDHSTALIKSLTGASSCSYSGAGECMPELAKWVHNTADLSSTYSGQQTLTVDTVAFYQDGSATGNQFLSDVATQGGGLYERASSADELTAALEKITSTTITEDTSFVAAGVSVNAFNRTLNRDDLYFSVFKPQSTPKWPGNLKKYKLAFDSSGAAYIKDYNGANAVDSSTGFFSSTSRSFWSASTDGSTVTKGGAASLITDYSTRKLYTDVNVATTSTLSDSSNALSTSNALLTKDLFDATAYSDTDFANLILWTQGKDVKDENGDGSTTDTRFVFADPLHSRPVAVTYGGTETSPDITLYVASNNGFLHAIDDDNGQEVFAYIPSDLLPLQKTLYENVSSVDHPYGLDGSITLWVIDPDGDGVVLDSGGLVQANNKVLLSVGMRRGGRNYYGLDVTDRSAPKLSWTIQGGITTGFEELGQTWSQPTKARIKLNGVVKRVLVFGGGYDPNQDNTTVRATDSMGRAVYIVDAETGALIWSGGNGAGFTTSLGDMKYSIPSTVSTADVNGDGLLDVFFVGDMGGQVWRFDVDNTATSASSLVKGGVIADLGVASGTNTATNNRRFFHSPSIFAGKTSNGTPYLGVGIGSGYRSHPLSTDTTDKFYVIRQTSIFSAPSTYTKLTESDLYNADANLIQVGDATQIAAATSALAGKQGWYITMATGEKVLSSPVVINGEMIFTTYQPSVSANADPCVPQTGTNRSYALNPDNGAAAEDFNGSGALDTSDRSMVIKVPGIVDSTKLTCTSAGCATMQGARATKRDMGTADDMHRIYWYENRTR